MHACRANDSHDSTDLENEFKTIADKLIALLSEAGVKNQAYHSGTPFFNALPLERKNHVLEHLRFYYELCAEQVQEGKSLRDSQTFTWRAMKRCSFVPHSGILSEITEGDIVEIYSLQSLQLFRNLEFFEHCSYTLEELYCCEWWRLYRRNEVTTGILMNFVGDVISGKYPEGAHYPVETHELEEIASSERFRVAMETKFVAPLYSQKSVKALIAIERVRRLSPGEGLGH